MEATLQWSPQQREALRAVREWMANRPQQCFYLGGYAGSGKTTLARHLAAEAAGRVEFAAFTGKAALVLQRAGCDDARTIHSLIYTPSERSRARLRELEEALDELPEESPERPELLSAIEEERANLRRPSFKLNLASPARDAALVVIDECSMVDEQMGRDLCSFNTPILVLGDPAQLPPVAASAGYFTRQDPDFMITEVHRQAEGSPVLRLATLVRLGGRLEVGQWGESRVLPPKALTVEEALTFDQIICGKNETRRAINARVRQALGRSGALPEEGDRLVCLRNDRNTGLLNGSFWRVVSALRLNDDLMRLALDDPDEGGAPLVVDAHTHHFEGRELPWWKVDQAHEFDYGYAITCHKAQGSQWPRVLVYDQSYIAREHRRKWLYTALTRASESVTVVLP